MPVTDVTHDLDALTLTLTARFDAPLDRVWQIYADPRQLEKVWGPVEYPATVVDHELAPGGRVTYYMTGPEGDRHYGYWEVDAVEEPRSFTFRDGFADETFAKNTELPESVNVYTFTEADGGTQAVYTSTFPSREGLEQVLAMGVVEGSTSAINQIDALLSAGASPTA
ncbi:SRPBCC family protein [Brachybacterium hainanense]|uniref:SRPBCC domain-containing protein n=1 Tax=Brachybacterium hainanense TaxID=1541174 RepID=A0ABV6R7Y4_9MICO